MSRVFEFSSSAIKGKRAYQEDYCEFIAVNIEATRESCNERSGRKTRSIVAALADGMGGHVGGAVASRTAVAGFKAYYTASNDMPPGQRLYQSLQAGNAAIAEKRRQDASLDGMGCTFVGALFDVSSLRWVSVGDSLIYLYRQGTLKRLNADHSMAPELDRMAACNEITVEQAQSDPMRHALRSAMMGDEPALIDQSAEPFPLTLGDWIIIASDGLETLGKSQICEFIDNVGKDGAKAVANALTTSIEAAGKPRQDNTTIMVVRVAEVAKTAFPGASQSTRGKIQPDVAMLKAIGIVGIFAAVMLVAIAAFHKGGGNNGVNANPSSIILDQGDAEANQEKGDAEPEEQVAEEGASDLQSPEETNASNSHLETVQEPDDTD